MSDFYTQQRQWQWHRVLNWEEEGKKSVPPQFYRFFFSPLLLLLLLLLLPACRCIYSPLFFFFFFFFLYYSFHNNVSMLLLLLLDEGRTAMLGDAVVCAAVVSKTHRSTAKATIAPLLRSRQIRFLTWKRRKNKTTFPMCVCIITITMRKAYTHGRGWDATVFKGVKLKGKQKARLRF